MGKRILLLAPDDYQLFVLVERNLLHLGYEVVTIINKPVGFQYKSFFQRIYSRWRKIVDRDNSYKRSLIDIYNLEHNLTVINQEKAFDYGLVFRADFFSQEVLKLAKVKSDHFVSYHYDGIERNPEVKALIPYFDRFFVFDKVDLVSNDRFKTHLAYNFFFDYDLELKDWMEEPIYDMFFLGYYNEGREGALLSFYKFVKEILAKIHFEIAFTPLNKHFQPNYREIGIHCRDGSIPFEEYLGYIKKSKIIVDFLIGEHNGLSFRIFEGLKYGKKVITTNSNVRNYDFYHPDNFFILKEGDYDKIEIMDFIERPYYKIDENIRMKYSFTNWLNYILKH